MKYTAKVIALAAMVSSSAAWAGVTPEALVGTWRSAQAVDTDVVITQTDKGLVLSEVHQNFHGGSRVENEPVTLAGNRVDIGTWNFVYDEGTRSLVTLIRPPSTYVSYQRVAPAARTTP